ncbi:hypothetical protein FFX82_07365 [Staphylococcus aureus]|uniref:hypothetical protein n=1 Tax=Staphylococcus aureus TaxID=1280 RepID=UPI001106DFD5|nr:hypothetical protein [Staphylococcus aureus]TLW65429.1 hypothetical protein FFX82_07365 [Staphylococcus aureus]
MHNKNEFNKKLKDFIGSDKRMALVKGYINEYKLTTVLRPLNNSDYTKGTIHTRSIGNLKQIVDNRIIPKNITQNKIFKLSNLTLEVNLYERNTIYHGDFAIYYPVESALIIETDTPRLINHINNNPVQKIFIITTNDWSFNTLELEKIVDETIIYDLKQEDPKQYEILYKNKHGKLPY